MCIHAERYLISSSETRSGGQLPTTVIGLWIALNAVKLECRAVVVVNKSSIRVTDLKACVRV